ncbi:DNA polymerase III subunit delta' [Vibrio rumoiensis 1S-45]|uniref:DNA polymerase III subunit delta' n=1 Tax=Vibrio rumoiensis 1S-45 TaxID=1188252 RepID=A0A1E5E3T6_9VIBR|nr:DNA polymerase III subunit delta' [Vibrio rumoiensis 1S-45]
MNELYPWLLPLWQRWKTTLKQGSIPHSMLCCAAPGTGIEHVITKLSSAIVCKNADDEACGFCHSCELSQSGHHPDIHWVLPEKEGKGINVEQIREANRKAMESSQLGGKRVIIINPAELMNESASNALLKTLETPPEKCVFILITSDKHKLLPTIISRCQSWQLPPVKPQVLMDWLQEQPVLSSNNPIDWFCLKMYAQSPVSALEFLEKDKHAQWETLLELTAKTLKHQSLPLAELQTFFKSDPIEKVSWLTYLFSDIQKAHFNVLELQAPPIFHEMVELVSYQSAYSHFHHLQQLHHSLKTSSGLNAELLIVDWFISLIEDR